MLGPCKSQVAVEVTFTTIVKQPNPKEKVIRCHQLHKDNPVSVELQGQTLKGHCSDEYSAILT